MNSFRPKNPIVLKVLLLAMALMLLSLPVFAGDEVNEDGVLTIKNGSTPSKGSEVVQLEEEWRHGGEDDDEFFGMISQCVVGDDGTIYLLDTRMSEVPVYSPDGERLDTLSREGDGPGETRTPSGMLFMPDGNLGLVQVFPGKITKIDTEGNPMGVMQIGDATEGGFMQMFDCVKSGEHTIIAAEKIDMEEGGVVRVFSNFVGAFDNEGHEVTRYYEDSVRWDFRDFTFDEDARTRIDFRKVAAGPDGRIYIATARNEYKIEVFNADGTPDRVITREYEHRVRSDEEYARVETSITAMFGQVPNAQIKISKTDPDIGGLVFGNDGNLWVSTSLGGTDQPDGVLTTWDVLSPDGHFIKTVSAACPGDGENDIIIWTPSGDAVMVTGFVDALGALQGGGGASSEEDGAEEPAPMEVIYMKVAGN